MGMNGSNLSVPMGRMYISEEMREVTMDILESGSWIKGPESKKFGKEWAEYCGAVGGSPCSNGSVALIAALRVLGVKHGDEVIVPSHTYISSATCISIVGAKPVFVEIEEEYYTIDPKKVEEAITQKTKAIIAVHLYGQPVNPEIFEIGKKNNIPVIEDAAQGHGGKLNGKMIGSFGDIATFSFFPSKNMAVGGDGGAITTTRMDLVEKIGKFIDHGRTSKYINESLGTNFRLSEIQCGIGRVQLRSLDSWVIRRNEIASKYHDSFESLPWAREPKIREGALHAWHQYVLRVPDRDKFQEYMKENGISTGIHYPIPCHLQPVYLDGGFGSEENLEKTERICEEIVSIPVFPLLSDEEVEHVISTIERFEG